jgi:hypothetical protein
LLFIFRLIFSCPNAMGQLAHPPNSSRPTANSRFRVLKVTDKFPYRSILLQGRCTGHEKFFFAITLVIGDESPAAFLEPPPFQEVRDCRSRA